MNPLWVASPYYYLKPGEIFFGDQATLVSTLLGSCVSITMFSPRCHIGAICHGLLPSCQGGRYCRGSCDEETRYVECAFRRMHAWFIQRSIVGSEIEVKVFGGSDMFDYKDGVSRFPSVGRQNIEKALYLIDIAELRLQASDLGGSYGRKICFSTYTGEVFLKRLKKMLF